MGFLTIAGLTVKEAVRRKTLIGALLLGMLVLGLSLLLIVIRLRLQQVAANNGRDITWIANQYSLARSSITGLCLFAIRALSSLFAILLAGGAISGEIERGLLAVILPKPIGRWQILLGKWIGLNIVLIGSVLVWAVMLWLSLSLQAARYGGPTIVQMLGILKAGAVSAFYPLLICTLTLSLSTFAQRVFGTSLAVSIVAFSYMDGFFNALAANFDVGFLRNLARLAGLVLPQGYVAWWVEWSAGDLVRTFSPRRLAEGPMSPQLMREIGSTFLGFPNLDAAYVLFYTLAVFAIGMVVFQRRDV